MCGTEKVSCLVFFGRSDELKAMCANLGCPPGKFRCNNFLCIPQTEVCDNYDDCDDGSDEDAAVCQAQGVCLEHQFRCRSGHCINASLACDHFNDCGDGSDELDCSPSVCPTASPLNLPLNLSSTTPSLLETVSDRMRTCDGDTWTFGFWLCRWNCCRLQCHS